MHRFNLDHIEEPFLSILQNFYAAPSGKALFDYLRGRIGDGAVIYPPDPLYAFRGIAFSGIRIVILGQDPYPTEGHAMGLAFSVQSSVAPLPRSLKNIYKELSAEYSHPTGTCGDLTAWRNQGVLLLNTVLTVEQGQAGAHQNKGWERLTDTVIAELARREAPTVFMLWGKPAQQKGELIRANAKGQVCILECNHPSPLSATRPPRPFIGCNHFRLANDWLIAHGETPVDWCQVLKASSLSPDRAAVSSSEEFTLLP